MNMLMIILSTNNICQAFEDQLTLCLKHSQIKSKFLSSVGKQNMA